ncbi:polycystic kidney disease protein 1-like 2, partial [Gouania willdenowi]|uniref:polycystic kidney disease protein 1-like 2 n=1 Tax=Gouania willdenowi TaxID=441366 RepID=UPI0010541CDC
MDTESGTWAALLMLLILIPLSCENEISPARCQKSQKAFRDSCFEFPALQLSFFRAQTWCEERRGHLVFITDEDTQSFLQRHLDPGTDVWIGLISSIDSSNKGGHGWLDGSPVGFSKWMDDDDLALNATCGRILGRSEYQWGATSDCTQTLPFICQFESGRAIVCADYNATLQCDPGRVVMIGSSFYGRNSLYYCRSAVPPPVTLTPPCSSWVDVTQATAALCNGRPSCQINDIWSFFGEQCSELSSYMSVDYQCEEGLSLSLNATSVDVLKHISVRIKLHPSLSEGNFGCELDTGDGRVYHFNINEGSEKNITHRYTHQSTFTMTANCTHAEVSISAQEVIAVEEPVTEVEVIMCYAGNQSFTANNCTALHGAQLLLQMELKSGLNVSCRILKGNISLSSLYVFNENVPQNMTVSEEKVKQLGPGCHNLTLSASNHITSSRVSRDFQVCIVEEIVGLQASILTDRDSCSSSVSVWIGRGAPVKLIFHLLGDNSYSYETRDMKTTRGEFNFTHLPQGLVRVKIKAWNDFSSEEVSVSASCGKDSRVKRVSGSQLNITAIPPEITGTDQSITLAISDPSQLDLIEYRYEWQCSQPCKCQGPFHGLTHVISGNCLPDPFEFVKYSFRVLEADNQQEKSKMSICITLSAILDTSSASRITCIQGCDPIVYNTDAIFKLD